MSRQTAGLALATLVAVSGCARSGGVPPSPGSSTRVQTSTQSGLSASAPRRVAVDPRTAGEGSSPRKPGVPYLENGTITTLDYRYALAVSSVTGAIAVETGGVTSGGDECWRLVSSTGAALSGQVCGPDRPMFNADGTQIATTSHPPTGVPGVSGGTGLEIFDASNLQPVAGFQAPTGGHFGGDFSWDGNAVLTSVWSRGMWTLVWLSPHGATTVRASPQPGRADHSPWNFGTGPLHSVH